MEVRIKKLTLHKRLKQNTPHTLRMLDTLAAFSHYRYPSVNAGGAFGVRDVQSLFAGTRSTVRRSLDMLVDQGLLDVARVQYRPNTHRKLYWLTELGQRVANGETE
jgi:DNA-binding MarR family transcriptional regulator